MQTSFAGKKITGILSVLPEQSFLFEDETRNFSQTRAERLKTTMGYGKRYRAKEGTTTSALCIRGLNYLLDSGLLKREDIGAVIVVTITPDFPVPHVSNIIHGECNLSPEVLCKDIPQACSGYMLGLHEAFMLLEHLDNKKVLLFTGDVLHRKEREDELFVEPPFGGDAASVTVIENDAEAETIHMILRTNGAERNCLVYPANGFHFNQGTVFGETADIGDGIERNPYFLNMDGSAVFNFVQREVPELINTLMNYAGVEKENMDWFLFHQPNRFMLEKLAQKLQIPFEKMYMNVVEQFGNSNSSTTPLVITSNFGKEMVEHEYKCCLSGFGAGLALGGAIMNLGNMQFCEILNTNL